MAADRILHPIHTKDALTTKEKLLLVGIRLFSQHGYEATTSRMIADMAETNVATMPFHFGNKENYYYEVLSYVADKVRNDYEPFWSKVKNTRMEKKLTPEQAWSLIEEYVDLLLTLVTVSSQGYEPNNMTILNLLFREQLTPAHGEYPITSVLCSEAEAVMNLLLMDYWQSEDQKTAIIVSRTVTAAIISFGEHPIFIRRVLGQTDTSTLDTGVWDTLRTFILNSIKKYRPEP